MPDAEPASRMDAGRVLLWIYALFVIAAGSRSAMQLGTHAARAPLAYSLSAVAAFCYAVGFVLLRRALTGGPRRPAGIFAVTELLGVLAIGTLSIAAPGLFQEPTVWSDYGSGYLLVPLILPLASLQLLRSVPITS